MQQSAFQRLSLETIFTTGLAPGGGWNRRLSRLCVMQCSPVPSTPASCPRVNLLQGCDPAALDRDGCTPLYCAAAWNRLDTVRTLARDLGCDPRAKSGEGRTPVHVAAEQVSRVLGTECMKSLKKRFPPKQRRLRAPQPPARFRLAHPLVALMAYVWQPAVAVQPHSTCESSHSTPITRFPDFG